jgi:hypothetical protein
MVIAICICGYLFGGEQAWGKLEWWLLVVLGGLIVFVLALFGKSWLHPTDWKSKLPPKRHLRVSCCKHD